MLKGFKDFLLRGNVIDLSVAVVMGAAFGAIVTAFTDKILKPLLNAITPPASPGLGVQLVAGKNSTLIDFASLITTAINFIMVAAIVYFVVVLPMHKVQKRRRLGEESGPAEPADVALLKEIRDLLRAQAGQATAYPAADEPVAFTQPRQPVPPAPDPAAAPGRPIGLLGESEPVARGRGDGAGAPLGHPGAGRRALLDSQPPSTGHALATDEDRPQPRDSGSGGRHSIATASETSPHDNPQPPAHSTGERPTQPVPPGDQGSRRSR